MIMNNKSIPWKCAKYLCILPLAAVAAIAFANPETSKPDDVVSNVKVSENTQETKNKENDKEVFIVVEQMPEFPGGMAELMKFISKNTKYPKDAQEGKIKGTVIVQFVVNKDGSTSDFEVKRSIFPSLDNEAVRVLKQMPKWTPGRHRGEVVAVRYSIPVTFRL